MRRAFSLAWPMGPCGTECPLTPGNGERGNFNRLGFGSQRKADLTTTSQLNIDLSKKLGVKQSAMFGAMAAINAIAGAERIKRVLRPWMPHPRHGDRIDHAFAAKRGQAAHFQFGIDEAKVEPGIVGNQHRFFADEFQKISRLFVKAWLVRQEGSRNAVNPLGLSRHVAIGIEIAVKRGPGRHPVDHFDATDFNQPITALGV